MSNFQAAQMVIPLFHPNLNIFLPEFRRWLVLVFQLEGSFTESHIAPIGPHQWPTGSGENLASRFVFCQCQNQHIPWSHIPEFQSFHCWRWPNCLVNTVGNWTWSFTQVIFNTFSITMNVACNLDLVSKFKQNTI
jgi:hypothetical protein